MYATRETYSMKDYKEFTFGWLIFVFVIPIHLFITYLYVNDIGDRPLDTNSYILTTLVFAITCSAFYGMTTKVNLNKVMVSFGVGLVRKKIALNRIKTVEAVKSPWYYGWGIRIIPNGILYNISGSNGIELKFNDTNRIIRIGTKNALTLKREIEKRLAQIE